MRSCAFKKCLCLLLAILLLSGCAGPKAAKYEADYALLWDTLEQDYPYLDYLRDKGIDVNGIRVQYEEKMKQAKTPEDMAAVLEGIFRELRNTAHLFLIRPEEFSFYYNVYTQDERISALLPSYEAVVQAAQSGYYKLPAEDSPQEVEEYYQPRQVEVHYYPD